MPASPPILCALLRAQEGWWLLPGGFHGAMSRLYRPFPCQPADNLYIFNIPHCPMYQINAYLCAVL